MFLVNKVKEKFSRVFDRHSSSIKPYESLNALPEINPSLMKKKSARFLTASKFTPADYEFVLKLFFDAGYIPLNLRQTLVEHQSAGERVVCLRHDVDHDFETAMRMAEWENARGLSSTYCVLHTAWYYGEFENGKYNHSREFIAFCKNLQEMGHEINLHNNFAAMSLTEGIDIESLIRNELEELRGHGIKIVGTSTHGDKLCRELKFYNFELFKERTWLTKGGDRDVEYAGNCLSLGRVDMKNLGLFYEAYDLPRDIYVTDSGGRARVRWNVRGAGGLRRDEMPNELPYPSIVGILTHPIWWDFRRESTVSDGGVFKRFFKKSGLSLEQLKSDAPHEREPVTRICWPIDGSDRSFKIPNRYREAMDEILYRAPYDIRTKPIKRIFGDKVLMKKFVAIRDEYLTNSEDQQLRQRLYESFILAPGSVNLLIEYFEQNSRGLHKKAKNRKDKMSIFSWPLSYLHLALAIGYERSKDVRLLDALIVSAEHMIEQSDIALGRSDDLRGRAMHNWGSERFVEGKYTTVITTIGRVAYPILRTALEAHKNEHHMSKYGDRIDKLLNFMKSGIDDYDADFIVKPDSQQGYYIRLTHGDIEPFNHMLSMGNAILMLWQLTNNSHYKTRATQLAYFFHSCWFRNIDETVSWCYQPTESGCIDGIPERTWKATITMHFAILAHQYELVFTDQDIDDICRTFLTNVIRDGASFNSRIGKINEPISRYPERKGGYSTLLPWLLMGGESSEVRQAVEQVASIPELGGWFRHPMGAIAYASRIPVAG